MLRQEAVVSWRSMRSMRSVRGGFIFRNRGMRDGAIGPWGYVAKINIP
jgi:hypothetical protein